MKIRVTGTIQIDTVVEISEADITAYLSKYQLDANDPDEREYAIDCLAQAVSITESLDTSLLECERA